MGQSLSKVKTIPQEIEKFLPVLRYKRISRQLQAENSQVKTHNQELQFKNEQLKVSVESFEKDNMQQSLKIQELMLENHHLQIKLESHEKSKVLKDDLHELREQISKIELISTNRLKTPGDIGGEGENFVLNCLQEAFPNNSGIVRTEETNCGDIMFRVENSNKILMFEVKNFANRSVPGRDLDKFFLDLERSQYHGAILVSLNSPVDINVPQLVPQLHKGKPYVYLDRLKDSRDPVCMMQVLVSMMTFMMNFASDLEHNSPQLQCNQYARQLEELRKLFDKLSKSNASQGKLLDSIKSKLLESKSSGAGKLSLLNVSSEQLRDQFQVNGKERCLSQLRRPSQEVVERTQKVSRSEYKSTVMQP